MEEIKYTNEDYVNIILSAISKGQKYGVYSLAESHIIFKAISSLFPNNIEILSKEKKSKKEKQEEKINDFQEEKLEMLLS